MFAAMIEHMHLVRIEVDAGRLVADERVVVPTVPQAGHHLGELRRAIVTVGVRDVLVAAVIERLGLVVGGDEVPAGPPAADLVQRGELPRQRIGLGVGRGRGGDQAEMRGHRGQRGQQRHRLEFHQFAHAAARSGRAEHADRGAVGEEQQVEFTALGGARDIGRLGETGAGMA